MLFLFSKEYASTFVEMNKHVHPVIRFNNTQHSCLYNTNRYFLQYVEKGKNKVYLRVYLGIYFYFIFIITNTHSIFQ